MKSLISLFMLIMSFNVFGKGVVITGVVSENVKNVSAIIEYRAKNPLCVEVDGDFPRDIYRREKVKTYKGSVINNQMKIRFKVKKPY